MTGIVAI